MDLAEDLFYKGWKIFACSLGTSLKNNYIFTLSLIFVSYSSFSGNFDFSSLQYLILRVIIIFAVNWMQKRTGFQQNGFKLGFVIFDSR